MAARTWRHVLFGLSMLGAPRGAGGQVVRMAELTSADIARLDRARTVMIVPGGILEEHGPFLPVYSDGYLNERLADTPAAAIAARAGWKAVVLPAIPLGNSAANDIGGRYSFPGTFAVRFETLRAVFMDLGDELGAQGFRWVFVVHLHTSMEGLVDKARAPSWPGYFGAPRLATVAHGTQVWRALADSTRRVAARLLDGVNPASIPRFAAVMASSPTDVRLDAASRRAEGERAARQAAWIRRRGRT
jgi:Creatinine amidohydrolase